MKQAYYTNTISGFLKDNNDDILGQLHKGITDYANIWTVTTLSWEKSLFILKENLSTLSKKKPEVLNWNIIVEYEIPRLLSRIDVVILAEDIIIIVEYKDQERKYLKQHIRQVEDYALDLSDFHLESKNKTIVPILLCTNAKNEDFVRDEEAKQVKAVLKANSNNLSDAILSAYEFYTNHLSTLNITSWINSLYSPTPSIVHAAQSIFAGHDVKEIAKSGADSSNLTHTTNYLIQKIDHAKINNKRVICFVTGVPGAGKTLVGLDVIHKQDINNESRYSAYFSGNTPLVEVLRYALNEDFKSKFKRSTVKSKILNLGRDDAKTFIKTKIQNLHNFIAEGIKNKDTLYEKIVIFDEAQRCWDADHYYNKTKRKNSGDESKNVALVRKSEPELLFEIMGRHKDWAVIIALVGSGQEINNGEAGIGEWERVLKERFTDWEICVAPSLLDGSTKIIEEKLFNNGFVGRVEIDDSLHLSTSQRTFKAINVNEWVNAMLSNNASEAYSIYQTIQDNFPVVITRNLADAKNWLKFNKQGNKKIGLVASSGANRLRPFGIYVKESIKVENWFFKNEDDIRSSDFLELVATEFAIQGLEIDWSCICWDIDLYRDRLGWNHRNFSGTVWQNVGYDNIDEKMYILNTYRVLLTRAREGMVIWVPIGDESDRTRPPHDYDMIYEYLKSCGVREI